MPKRYTVSDGKLMLTLERMGKGDFLVRSPMDPEILTSAKSVDEAFLKAYDVVEALRESRKKWARQIRMAKAG